MPITRSLRTVTSALLAVAVVLLTAPGAMAQSNGRGDRATSWISSCGTAPGSCPAALASSSSSRATATCVVLGKRAAAGRRLGRSGQVAEVDNAELVQDRRGSARRAASTRPADLRDDGTDRPVDRRSAGARAAGRHRQGRRRRGDRLGHHELARRPLSRRHQRALSHFKDFTNDTSVWSSNGASDDYGHGTHVAGIIAGTGYDSNGKHKGIAPGAKLVGLKVIDRLRSRLHQRRDRGDRLRDLGQGAPTTSASSTSRSPSGVFESVLARPAHAGRAARRRRRHRRRRLGRQPRRRTSRARSRSGGITSPGNAPWVLTVGASSEAGTSKRSNDTIAKFSSRGPTWIDFAAKPDLVAPGVGIESLADPHSTLYATLPGMLSRRHRSRLAFKPYLSLSGTSMSAPVVAGTVALMLEANPKLTPNAVKAILQYTAQVAEQHQLAGAGRGHAERARRRPPREVLRVTGDDDARQHGRHHPG